MMELGATLCLRTKPKCTRCPLLSVCAASREKNPEKYPRFLPKKTSSKTLSLLWITRKEKLLLYQRPHDTKRLATLYELPTAALLCSAPKAPVSGGLKRDQIGRFEMGPAKLSNF